MKNNKKLIELFNKLRCISSSNGKKVKQVTIIISEKEKIIPVTIFGLSLKDNYEKDCHTIIIKDSFDTLSITNMDKNYNGWCMFNDRVIKFENIVDYNLEMFPRKMCKNCGEYNHPDINNTFHYKFECEQEFYKMYWKKYYPAEYILYKNFHNFFHNYFPQSIIFFNRIKKESHKKLLNSQSKTYKKQKQIEEEEIIH